MTKKIFRIISLTVAVVMTVSLLVGCALFPTNEERYREQTAITVGSETINVAAFQDFYTNTMSQYVSAGYDIQTIWDSLGEQLLLNYIVLNEIKSDTNWVKSAQDSAYADLVSAHPATEYLRDPGDMELLLKNVRQSLYESLDDLTETELSNKYELEEAEEETERTLNILEPVSSLAAADFNEDVEELDKYLGKFRACELTLTAIVENYVFDLKTDIDKINEILEGLNERIVQEDGVEEGDEGYKTISASEYVAAQKVALTSMARTVKDNYFGWTMEEFLDYQLDGAVMSRLAQEYAERYYTDIEDLIKTRLSEKLANLKAEKEAYYKLYPSMFTSDVTALDNDTFLYYVPEEYNEKYLFVKNLLIQFSDEQTAKLAYYEQFGKDSKEYIEYRNKLATELVMKDYENDENEIENVFKLDGAGNVVLNDGVLKTALDGFATMTVKERTDAFIKLIDKYNQDPGMQGSAHDYVLRIEEADVAGTADSWVAEFAAAGREAYNEDGFGSWRIAVTDFGVHVVYVSSFVEAETFDFEDDEQLYTPGTSTYRFFRAYYDEVKDSLYDHMFEELYESYFEDGKITVNEKVMKKLLKEYGFELNWDI